MLGCHRRRNFKILGLRVRKSTVAHPSRDCILAMTFRFLRCTCNLAFGGTPRAWTDSFLFIQCFAHWFRINSGGFVFIFRKHKY